MPLTSDITINNISGNAGTATRLQTARRINNVLFDGSGDITIPAGMSQSTADARYIQNVQLGAQVQGGYQAPTGCVVTFVDGGEKMEFIKYKPVQIYINGAWRTISG
ncbi:TPA: phage tail protein [Escherichia coli]|nr:phage tail protein [Escherichia coli]HCP5061959.1 phage tail protein [Escherichia coli]